jgi:hypothetical protein
MATLPDGVILDRRFFNGNFKEYGPYAADGTVTGGTWEKLPRTAIKFTGNDNLSIPSFAESNTTEGTILVYGDISKFPGYGRMFSKQDVTGSCYSLYLISDTALYFVTDTIRIATFDWKRAKSLGVTFKSGEIPKAWRDGSFTVNFNTYCEITKFNQEITIGNYFTGSYGLDNPLSGALMWDRQLSASEMTQAQEWIDEQTSSTKSKEIKNYKLDTDTLINDPDIKHAYDFKMYKEKIYDLVGGEDLAVGAGYVSKSHSLVGNMIEGPSSITGLISDTANDVITLEFYGSFDETGVYSGPHIGPSGLSKYIYIRTSSVFDKFAVSAHYDGSNGIAFSTDASAHAYIDKPALMHATISNSAIKFYINGVEMSGTTIITGTPQLQNIARSKISMNSQQNSAGEYKQHNGWFAIFDSVKSAEWVKARAEQFKRTVFFDDLSDANVSTAVQNTLMLENTKWGIASGGWKISEDTVHGKEQRVIECASTGRLSTGSDQAYGTWEFDWYLNSALLGTRRLIFMDTRRSAFQSGYGLAAASFPTSLYFQKYWNGVASNLAYTVPGYLVYDTWYKLRVTRPEYGVFTWYIKGGIYTNWTKVDVSGGAGTNPTVENATTNANYIALDFYSGDKITEIEFTNQVVDPT